MAGMLDTTFLPVPDWGLRCPHCGAALAGLTEHKCGTCGKWFNVLTVVAQHRPIPDLGLSCPSCGYSLTGLDGNRCPECGKLFFLAELLEDIQDTGPPAALSAAIGDPSDHHVARRRPSFTGNERPLPDFGLECRSCGMELAGATQDDCPSCGKRFDLRSFVPAGEWVCISQFIPDDLAPIVRPLLYDDQVPYLTEADTLENLYWPGPGRTRILVPREFFFDALHALTTARSVAAHQKDEGDWVCPSCDESVPGNFAQCWNCQTWRPEAEPA